VNGLVPDALTKVKYNQNSRSTNFKNLIFIFILFPITSFQMRHPVTVINQLRDAIEKRGELTPAITQELNDLIVKSRYSAPENEEPWFALEEFMRKNFPGPLIDEYVRIIQGTDT